MRLLCVGRSLFRGSVKGHVPLKEYFVNFKDKFINLVHVYSSKLRAITHVQCANWIWKKSVHWLVPEPLTAGMHLLFLRWADWEITDQVIRSNYWLIAIGRWSAVGKVYVQVVLNTFVIYLRKCVCHILLCCSLADACAV